MSTWTSKGRVALALSALMALPACLAGVLGGEAARAITVTAGAGPATAVTIAGPAGYCIDRGASRDGAEGGFVLLGTCAALTGVAQPGTPARPAVLTATVRPGAPQGAPFSASFPAMSRFLRTVPGRAAMSRSGRAGTVSLAEVLSRGEVLYLGVRDTSASAGQPVEPDYWRAILALRGQIVTLSAQGLRDRPLPGAEKRRVLEAFVAAVRAANRTATP